MRYDKQVKVMKQERVDDGMGGFEEGVPVVVSTIMGYITPLSAEMLLKEHGIVTTTGFKVITKDHIPKEYDFLEIDGTTYKVLQLSDLRKLRVLLVEVIIHG
ncbi:hypothetical protein ACQVSN_27055 [Bacillus mobilis]|uniref:hypothetical protein n=1 Tax=Bacillus mobilis TaxID=2026190 RepID=UPI003D65A421